MPQTLTYKVPAPAVETDEDVGRLLYALGLVGGLLEDDEAEAARRVAAVKAEIEARQFVLVAGERIAAAEYYKAAHAAVRLYCEQTANRERLLADVRGKTRTFTHGSVAWKKRPAFLADVDGSAATTAAKLLGDEEAWGVGGLVARLLKFLGRLRVNKAAAASDLFRFEIKPDRGAILKLAVAGKLDADWLAARNLKVEDGGEEVVIKPDGQTVRSERRAA